MAEKKKGFIPKLLLAIIVLTLISCCFLGYTFARYTSRGTGNATVKVAKWDVTITPAASEEVNFTRFVPSTDDFKYTEATQAKRSNTSEKILVATLTNSGDVKAEVTVEAPEAPNGYRDADGKAVESFGNYQDTDVDGLFSIEFFATTVQENPAESDFTSLSDVTYQLAASGTVYIYAEVTWTSADEKGEADADALDTYVGENIAKVEYEFSFKAVQVSGDTQNP